MTFINVKGKKGEELPEIRERFEMSSSGHHAVLNVALLDIIFKHILSQV